MIYILQTYEYNTFSYSGIIESEFFLHSSEQGAKDHAAKRGLKIVNSVDNPEKECIVFAQELLA